MSQRNPLDLSTYPPLMTPGEVADACRVDPKTVTRWAKAGKLISVRSPGGGGHRRYLRDQVQALLLGSVEGVTDATKTALDAVAAGLMAGTTPAAIEAAPGSSAGAR